MSTRLVTSFAQIYRQGDWRQSEEEAMERGTESSKISPKYFLPEDLPWPFHLSDEVRLSPIEDREKTSQDCLQLDMDNNEFQVMPFASKSMKSISEDNTGVVLKKEEFSETKNNKNEDVGCMLIENAKYPEAIEEQKSLQPFEALYVRKCRSALFVGLKLDNFNTHGPEIVQETTERIIQVKAEDASFYG
ncbi:hypothetical protein Tco_0938515 [Tanacetum coccineum]|uniref:Uncharacterized protein n=1 Tax=Tanacetum coccineum TaxID=301880 RepID=A0ABQ5DI12_9ASTR